MRKFFNLSAKKTGLSPGTLLYIGEQIPSEIPEISVIQYDKDRVQEFEFPNIDECTKYAGTELTTWFNINGLHDIDTIRKLGDLFNIHDLALEDILNIGQRPKCEEYEDFIFIVMKMMKYDPQSSILSSEQISIITREKEIITFFETKSEVFATIIKRIKGNKWRIKRLGTDYLTYALIDTVVDNYFVALENIENDIEELEESILSKPEKDSLDKLHKLKSHLLFMRKQIAPLREAIKSISAEEYSFFKEYTLLYMRDVYDHITHVLESIDSFRDMLNGLIDAYISNASNHMNQVMKVLTIIATIFIPLTFIAGIYGMNFKFMPELDWKWGYFVVWGIMITLGIIMLILFRKKKWL